MRLLHRHCILLRQLYTCPVLFGLMLLHIFLILPVIADCTGWYNFLPVLSIGSHIVSVYIPIECLEAMRDGAEYKTEIVLPVDLIKRESTRKL